MKRHSVEPQDTPPRYIVGIDLGTTNSALAYVDRAASGDDARRIRLFEVPQLMAAGEMGKLPVLPSFLYLPGPYELPEGGMALPWNGGMTFMVGEFAREQGAHVPGRLVSSAKSWLCHAGVDRTAAILPWGAGGEVARVSPVEASSRYLLHLREAWNHAMARGNGQHALERQFIVLTVPASFDEVSRELTVAAARAAGFSRLVLIEEPLAAFYSWLSTHERDWEQHVAAGQIILVCDVGGGTTDFTIVAVREGEHGLRFDRLAVGDHLMLGGDNMDLALARHIEMKLLGKPGQLDARRWQQLWAQCRKAKERLLGGLSESVLDRKPKPAKGGLSPASYKSSIFSSARPAPGEGDSGEAPAPRTDTVDIALVGEGRKLIGGTLKATLDRDRAESVILEGFFPEVPLSDESPAAKRTGITEWGLPYVQDAAVTRHLAAFWRRYAELAGRETGRERPRPDFLLFNGGALAPYSIRDRLMETVGGWFRREAGEGRRPEELENPRPDLAVAMGAAYYGLVREGDGVRVGAGSPRSYYVRVDAPVEGEPDAEAGTESAVCLLPRGVEEGFETELEAPAFEVLANRPAAFEVLTSSTRVGDRLGEIVRLREDEVTALPPIRTVLRYGKKSEARSIPIHLAVRLTEVGTLEMWCRSRQSPHRWQLQFDVRQEVERSEAPELASGETLDAAVIEEGAAKIGEVFSRGDAVGVQAVDRIVKDLVSIFDLPRERWALPLLRKMADALLESASGRDLGARHEARWLNLLGYAMRPGFGDPLDEWRMKEIWKAFPAGPRFPRQPQARIEWWIFWRRVAGGLSSGQQMRVYQQISSFFLESDKRKQKQKKSGAVSMSPQEDTEIWMMTANFERLPANVKVDLGRNLLERIVKGKPRPQDLWALSRFGARVPFYGPVDQVIPAAEASRWLKALLDSGAEAGEGLVHTLVQIGKRTGDRVRDLPEADVERLCRWLETTPQGEKRIAFLTDPDASADTRERDWIFGESLPAGLILATGSEGREE